MKNSSNSIASTTPNFSKIFQPKTLGLACATALLLAFSTTQTTAQTRPNLGNLTNYLFFFADGRTDANWQGATKGFAGNVAIDGIQAKERTSGGVPFAGTIYTNNTSLEGWAGIVTQNATQAFASLNQTALVAGLEADLTNAFTQINALPVSVGYANKLSTSLNGLNTQNSVAEMFVINITTGLSISTKINITGDASDLFILRWDSDGNPNNGYQGTVKFQSGGAVVPMGGLKPSNFINVAGNINSSGGGSNPAAPYPQGPRQNNGTGALVANATNFSGGGFFTGYWLTTGDPVTGETSPLSNGIFVGGWYSTTTKFSMTSGTSGVYVAPPPTTAAMNTCMGEAANYVLLGLQGGSVSINSGTNILGDVGYSAGVTAATNQKVGDHGTFSGTAYVHGSVAQFGYASQNFLPTGGIVQNNAAQNTRLNQANASAVAASATFAAMPPNVVLGVLGDNDNRTVNRVGKLTVVQITSLDYKEDQLTLVGQAGQDDAFVVNVLGNFSFSGGIISLQNVRPNRVVFNFPNASTVYLNKATNIFNGTILAPIGSVEYHNPAVFNGGIVAKNITVHSDFNITSKPLDIPCDLGGPTTVTVQTSQNACAGTGYFFNGLLRTVSGVYRDTLTRFKGGDSIIVLTLTIVPLPNLATTDAAICAGQSIELADLVTDLANTTGTLSFYPSLADAQNGTNPLGNTFVSPAQTTWFYARKTTAAAGCTTIKSLKIKVNQVSATASGVCANNNTPWSTADDVFTATFNVANAGATAGDKFEVLYNGLVLNPGGTVYGTAFSPAQTFLANGNTIYSFVVRDAAAPGCTAATLVGPVFPCSISALPMICLPDFKGYTFSERKNGVSSLTN